MDEMLCVRYIETSPFKIKIFGGAFRPKYNFEHSTSLIYSTN